MELQNILSTKTTIGILGLGAIGTVMAYHLQDNISHDLYYFSRTKKKSLKIIQDYTPIEISINLQTNIASIKPLDWLIICLKEHQYVNAKQWFSKLITLNTKIVVIRNGINLKAPLLEFTKAHQILECMIDCPTQLNQTDFYQYHGKPKITIPKSNLASDFESLFNTRQMDIIQVTDFKTENWKKLCESATLGAILCKYNDTCRIFKDEIKQKEYLNLMNETIKVAIADGALIEPSFNKKMLAKLMSYPATKGSSMLVDFRNGQPLELGAKNGIISQLGKHYNIPTPINDMLIKLLS